MGFFFGLEQVASLLTQHAPSATAAPGATPVVIVGAGPVGIKAAQELHRRSAALPIVVYGDEPSEPYNRVRLSAFLSGELNWQALTRDLALPHARNVEARLGCAVVSIDRDSRTVRDAAGWVQPYSKLVLATGSRPRVPTIRGIDLPGVYTFRDARDAQELLARRVRSRRTIVLGGGLLGLEAARAMQRFNTHVSVVEHYSRLMMRQLDEDAAGLMLEHVRELGIEVILSDSISAVEGDMRVSGITLRSGRTLPCDTVIVAAGIQPNVELALAAGLHINRGIRVDDFMRTSDPSIYAIGECAEHRGLVYGIVAPGFEQAAVAAHLISGGDAVYSGSSVASRLKIVALPTFSMGLVTEEEVPDIARSHVHRDGKTYRKIVSRRGKLIGALAVGECPELSRLQEAVLRGRRMWPWQAWRFRLTGRLYPVEELASVCQWPASTTVCNCTGVTRGALGSVIAEGARTVEELAARTGASTVCGSCRPLLAELVGGGLGERTPARGFQPLAIGAGMTVLVAALLLGAPSIPYPETAELAWRWDAIWRETFWKQVSGFTVLGLAAIGLVMSLRKRARRMERLGAFTSWRLVHVLLGVATLAVLAVHTGGRLGAQLNLVLSTIFIALALVGGIAGAVIALEHRLAPATVRRLRTNWTWLHILLVWPVPALLVFHVLKTYYF
jgi:nitrite reductase (NADH) large subunit